MTKSRILVLVLAVAILGLRSPFAVGAPPAEPSFATREVAFTEQYLNLPVKTGAPKRRVALEVGGKVVREFKIELANTEPGFWVFLDVSEWKGQTGVLKCSPEGRDGLNAVECLPHIKGAKDLYKEPLRPQFHFSSRRGWNNDPNGMVFFKGEYHLYYQHNPYGWDWGNMHWGHAVSKDLVHWKELPIALYPRQFGDWAFSGSAVVDWENSSGFQKGKEPPLVLAYTSTGRGECIAYSHDRGRTWIEYAGNPVVKHEGRDPRLLWHAPSERWVMALYHESEKKRWITFHTSTDLKQWDYQSRIEGFYECPDLVELPVDNNPKDKKWVLSGASSEYMVGSFDGKKFTPETGMLPGHRGNAFYAAQTFSDIPAKDGRCIQIGWGRVPTSGMPFNQMMCFPTVMTLRNTPEGPRLAWEPVKEIAKLRAQSHRWKRLSLDGGAHALHKVRGNLLEARLELAPGTGQTTLTLAGTDIIYDGAKQALTCEGVTQPLISRGEKVRVTALLDRTSIEIFADDGMLYMPLALKRAPSSGPTSISGRGEVGVVSSLVIHELNSSWR